MSSPAMTQPASALRVTVADDEATFRGLAGAWNQLAQSAHGAKVFFRFEWFDAAWQWNKCDCQPCILCVYRAEQLIGICPLMLTSVKRFPFNLKVLKFFAVPDTQFCDIICSPADAIDVCRAVAGELKQRSPRWDMLDLRNLDAASNAAKAHMPAIKSSGFAATVVESGANPYVPLDGKWEGFYSTRSRSLKKANNLCANRLKKSGTVEISWIRGTDQNCDDIEQALEHIIALSSRSWKKETGLSLDNEAPGRFIRTLTRHAAAQGWLSIWLLTLDQKPLAMEYQLICDGNVYALRSDFDAQFNEISPGSHLNRALLERLFGNGFQRYYMGPGDNSYKARWTELSSPQLRGLVYGPSLAGICTALLDQRLRPAARWLRQLTSRPASARPQTKESTA